MNVKQVYIISGYLSIGVGILAAMSVYSRQYTVYGIACSILGFILAITNIFLNTKYYYEQEKFPKGYLGMFLSSLPVLFMMFLIFNRK